jgi:hypothetical protein
MCVFRIRLERPNFASMKWKVIRLELASSWQFPRGSAGRSYLIRMPLTDAGAIDSAALQAQPSRATVRRYWPNEADMVGHLVQAGAGYGIRYEMNGSAARRNGCEANGHADPRLFPFGADAIRVGEEMFLTEPDGHQVRYRIASLQ